MAVVVAVALVKLLLFFESLKVRFLIYWSDLFLFLKISEHEVDKLVEKCRYDYFPGIKNYELGESANKCTMACIMTKGGVVS